MNAKPVFPALKIEFAVLALLFVASLGMFAYDNLRAGSEPWQVVASSLLLMVPLGLFFGSLGLLLAAWQQKRALGRVDARLARFIYLAPRVAGVLIVVFVGLFSLDVFEGEGSLWMKLGGFLMHSLPSIGMAICLALAWRRPAIGFWAFLLAAIFFLRFALGDFLGGLGIVLLFSGPMLAIALLFLADWKWKN